MSLRTTGDSTVLEPSEVAGGTGVDVGAGAVAAEGGGETGAVAGAGGSAETFELARVDAGAAGAEAADVAAVAALR